MTGRYLEERADSRWCRSMMAAAGTAPPPCQTQGPKQELNRRGQGTRARWNQ
jgi:hypothetical protein